VVGQGCTTSGDQLKRRCHEIDFRVIIFFKKSTPPTDPRGRGDIRRCYLGENVKRGNGKEEGNRKIKGEYDIFCDICNRYMYVDVM
jgi:hypothetical protein